MNKTWEAISIGQLGKASRNLSGIVRYTDNFNQAFPISWQLVPVQIKFKPFFLPDTIMPKSVPGSSNITTLWQTLQSHTERNLDLHSLTPLRLPVPVLNIAASTALLFEGSTDAGIVFLHI